MNSEYDLRKWRKLESVFPLRFVTEGKEAETGGLRERTERKRFHLGGTLSVLYTERKETKEGE